MADKIIEVYDQDSNTTIPVKYQDNGDGTYSEVVSVPGGGGGEGGGDVSSNTSSSVNGEVALFSGTGGKTIKRATGSGIPKLTSGVQSIATEGTDYYKPGATDVAVGDGGTGASTASAARSNLGLAIGTDVLAPSGDGSSLTGMTKSQVGLPNVDNTADTAKPVSTAQQSALDLKADTADLADVAFSGSYNDLSDVPAGGGGAFASGSLEALGASSFTVDSLPTGLYRLEYYIAANDSVSDGTTDDLIMRFNGDSSNNYITKQTNNDTGTVSVFSGSGGGGSGTTRGVLLTPGASADRKFWYGTLLFNTLYASGQPIRVMGEVIGVGTSYDTQATVAARWSNSGAQPTSITLLMAGGASILHGYYSLTKL